MEAAEPITFTASAISGAGRGKEYGIPTINVNLASVPEELQDGIYACFVQVEESPERLMGAMHYGPRPVFRDSRACEVHLLDTELAGLPASVTVTVVEHLRPVQDFPDVEALKEQILDDIERCRAILGAA